MGAGLSLERTASDFYRRVSPTEEARIKRILGLTSAWTAIGATYVEDSAGRRTLITPSPIVSIAGVGGVLRKENSAAARDIDIVVVTEHEDHGFDSVVEFTNRLYGYFLFMAQQFEALHVQPSGKHSSGPFPRLDQVMQGENVELRTNLEEFSYGAKGAHLLFPDCRPIDVLWSYMQPGEWFDWQTTENLPYAILHRSHILTASSRINL